MQATIAERFRPGKSNQQKFAELHYIYSIAAMDSLYWSGTTVDTWDSVGDRCITWYLREAKFGGTEMVRHILVMVG